MRTARLGMLWEMVEFFENSLPDLLTSVIRLAGTVFILSALNRPVFLGCLAVAAATVVLYALTGNLTTRYNQGLNDQHEREVDAVESGDPARVGRHLRDMMRWNHQAVGPRGRHLRHRLGAHGSGCWSSRWRRRRSRPSSNGMVLAVVMYVFEFAESVTPAPLLLPAVAPPARDLGAADRRHRGVLTALTRPSLPRATRCGLTAANASLTRTSESSLPTALPEGVAQSSAAASCRGTLPAIRWEA